MRAAVVAAEPDAIVHQATALADATFSRNLDRSFAPTNRLRTEGTDALLAAAREAGVRRFVAQSFASSATRARAGRSRPRTTRSTPPRSAAMRETQRRDAPPRRGGHGAGGIALRYGGFYGAANDGLIEPVRKRQFPIVGDGGGVSSFIHLDDAAAATVLALEHDGAGIYNIVDDEPAPGARVAAGARGARSAPSRPATCRAGSRGCSRARPRS